jgi:hypothetical protein
MRRCLRGLASSLVIVSKITCLAHAHRVKKAVRVSTFRSVLTSAILPVTAGAHILSVMLAMNMSTLGDRHHFDGQRGWHLSFSNLERVYSV